MLTFSPRLYWHPWNSKSWKIHCWYSFKTPKYVSKILLWNSRDIAAKNLWGYFLPHPVLLPLASIYSSYLVLNLSVTQNICTQAPHFSLRVHWNSQPPVWYCFIKFQTSFCWKLLGFICVTFQLVLASSAKPQSCFQMLYHRCLDTGLQ